MHFPFPPGSLKVRTTEERSFYIIYVYLKKKKKNLYSQLLIQRSKNLAEKPLVMQVKTEKTSETHPSITSDSFLSNLSYCLPRNWKIQVPFIPSSLSEIHQDLEVKRYLDWLNSTGKKCFKNR